MSKVIVILGPTASGKSSLAVKLAKKFNGEIVNADSRQIYKKMDIGTGKISRDKISNFQFPISKQIPNSKLKNSKLFYHEGIRHHLFDIVEPDKPFTLTQYQRLAFRAIDDILRRKKVPILAGGTGLYVRAVIDNLDIPRVAPNKKLREKLEKSTADALFAKLKKLDPKTAETIDRKNPRRLIRALEVILAKNASFKELQKTRPPRYEIVQIGLKIDRKILRQKIEKRFRQMIKNGLIEETKKLLKKYSPDLPSMSGIGYLETSRFLNKEISLDRAIELAVIRTYQYSKRQMTWFKRDRRINWISKTSEANKFISNFLHTPSLR